MSFTALKTAMKLTKGHGLGMPAKLVFMALSDRHNQETGRCDPSVKTIADDTEISERAIITGLRQLEKAGLITTTHRTIRTGKGKRNMSNRYRLKTGPMGTAGNAPTPLQDMQTKQEPNKTTPKQTSAFDDLAMSIEDDDYEF